MNATNFNENDLRLELLADFNDFLAYEEGAASIFHAEEPAFNQAWDDLLEREAQACRDGWFAALEPSPLIPGEAAYVQAVAEIMALPERRIECDRNARILEMLQGMCDRIPDLELALSDLPTWVANEVLWAAENNGNLWSIGARHGFYGEPIHLLAPGYLLGWEWGRGSELGPDWLTAEAAESWEACDEP